jgi:hypothetical protein
MGQVVIWWVELEYYEQQMLKIQVSKLSFQ